MKARLKEEYLLLFYLLIILGILLTREAKGDTIGEVTKVVRKLQPKHDSMKAIRISKELLLKSKKLDMDWKLWLAMLYQESRLLADPHNCLELPDSCQKDVGIGQVNLPVWGDVLKLDKQRLLSDETYGIIASYSVLRRYKKQYGYEMEWWSRYHSSTPKYRTAYTIAVNEWRLLIERMMYGNRAEKTIYEERATVP